MDIKVGDLLYTINEDTGKLEIDKVIKSGMTSESREVMKLTFDNGQELVCTPNHPIAVRVINRDELGRVKTVDGKNEHMEWVEAKDIKVGMRIKSNYIEYSDTGYRRFRNGKGYEHKMVYEYFSGTKIQDGYIVHHKDGNKLNNEYENLELMSSKEHKIIHMDDTIRRFCKTSDGQMGEKNSFYGRKHSLESKRKISEKKKGTPAWNRGPIKEIVFLYCSGHSLESISEKFSTKPEYILKKLEKAGVPVQANHVVTNIEYLKEKIPVYDITMEHNHNFFVGGDKGILVHNSGRFVRIDKEKYGILPGITDRDYYTNSFHVPVYYNISAYDKIAIEAPYHALTNAGHISYIEMDGDPTNNLEAFEKVIRCMKEKGIGYGSVNHPVDRDPICGFSGIIGDQCPGCGRKEDDVPFERIRRITGYLVGTLDRFNNAKRAEEHDRVKHGT